MSFILRIFFSGLMTFVPSHDGKVLTVLLVNSGQGEHSSTMSSIPEHRALVLVHAESCDGACTTHDGAVSSFLYPGVAAPAAADSLVNAVSGGAVWQLSGSNLTFGTPTDGVTLVHDSGASTKSSPGNDTELSDFGWVASLHAIDPAAGNLLPSVLSPNPPRQLITARVVLKSGKVSTYSVVEIGGQAKPIEFRPVGGTSDKAYRRALANWVEAEIEVPGKDITIFEKTFDDKSVKRKMTLVPHDGVVEMAILNIPQPTRRSGPPGPGTHFARYWDLVDHPPAQSERPIPQVPAVAPDEARAAATPIGPPRSSVLLDQLLFTNGRDPYDQLLCPMSQVP
jgi:hypothetical protein